MPAMDMSTLIPGMNMGGTNNAIPSAGGSGQGPAVGGNTNPLLPTFPSASSMPSNSNPMAGDPNAAAGGNTDLTAILAQGFPANGTSGPIAAPGTLPGGGGTQANGGGFNLASALGLGQGDPNSAHDFVKAMHKAGFSSGVAGQLWNFLQSGAGFNQGILNNMLSSIFAAQQPQIARGEADIKEQFGAMGLGMSSPAAIGLGDYLSQVSLGQGELAATMEEQMWQQSVQNYLSVLMGGKGNPPQNMFQNLMQWISTESQAAKNLGITAAG